MTRFGWLATTYGALLLVAACGLAHPRPRWLWNASASVREGLYALRPAAPLKVGDLVAATPPQPLAGFLAVRRYLPPGVPLVKHVTALPPQVVCRTADAVSVDGRLVGRALARDRRGRRLPTWAGCHRLGGGEVFLMNLGVPDSLDGRYFGALPAATILGRAVPVWIGQGARPWPAGSSPRSSEHHSTPQPEAQP